MSVQGLNVDKNPAAMPLWEYNYMVEEPCELWLGKSVPPCSSLDLAAVGKMSGDKSKLLRSNRSRGEGWAVFVPVLFHVATLEFQDMWLVWRGRNSPKLFVSSVFFSPLHANRILLFYNSCQRNISDCSCKQYFLPFILLV